MTIKALRWLSVFVLLLAIHHSASSQTITNVNPTITLMDGGAFYIHEVLEGQEIENIAKAYYAEIADIVKANPEIRTGLKVGTKLKIPYSDESLEAMSNVKVTESVLTEIQPKKIEQKPDRVPATPILPQKQAPKPANQSPMQEAVSLLDEAMKPEPKPAPKPEIVAPKPEPLIEKLEEKPSEKPLVEEPKEQEMVEEMPETNLGELTKVEPELMEEPKAEPVQPKVETPKVVQPKSEEKVAEKPAAQESEPEAEDLLSLSERIKESLNALEMMKQALTGEETEVVGASIDEDHYFAMDFLEDHLKERFQSDSSIQEFYLKEYFLARINPNGVIISVRDERTTTNQNTQDLNIEDVADLTLYSYPNVNSKAPETALGLNADVKIIHYKLKVKKHKIKVYKEAMYAEHLPKDHIHYEMIMQEAEKQGKRGKCEVIIWDGFLYTARYKKVEYNPFAEMLDVVDERRIQQIVEMRFSK